jgi:ligand-binding sensor domain-containing protein
MKNCILLFLAIHLLFHLDSKAQSSSQWIHLIKPGYVSEIKEDSSFIWVSTFDFGLIKINKQSDQVEYINKANSDLPFNEIHTFHLSDSGKIYIGGNYRIAVYDDSKWVEYNTNNSNIGNVGYIRDIVEDNHGKIWFGSDFQGLHTFDGINFNLISAGSSSAVCVDTANLIWSADPYSQSIYAYKSNGSIFYFYSSITSPCVPDAFVTSIKANKKNEVWVCSSSNALGGNGGIAYFQNGICNHLPYMYNSCEDLSFDSSGTVYIANFDLGILRFNGNYIDTLNSDSLGISSNAVNKVYFDFENNMWFATKGHLYRIKNNVLDSFKLSPFTLPSNSWTSIYINSLNEKYIQYAEDIYSPSTKFYTQKTSNVDTVIFSNKGLYYDYVEDSLGSIWIGTTGGIIKLDDTSETFFPFPSNYPSYASFVNTITIGKNNEIWAGTSNGLYKFSNNSWSVSGFSTPNGSLSIGALYYDEGTDQLLGGFKDNYGIYALNSNNQWSSLPFLVNSNVIKIFKDANGCIWFITRTGGFIETDPMFYFPVYHNITNDFIRTACADYNNYIYACSNYRFYKYDGNSWDTLSIYNSDYLLLDVTSMQADQFNNIWIVGLKGICIYNENEVILDFEKHLENDYKLEVFVYPNPSSGLIQLRTDDFLNNVQIELFSINGQRVILQKKPKLIKGENLKLNLSHLDKGIYILNINCEKGFISRKVIVQ